MNENRPTEEIPGGDETAAIGYNEQLIEAFESELARLREADSDERSVLYEKAAELGVLIIKGQS